jgi:predicted small lipoprotein YifL
MTVRVLALALVALVAACGIDGPPVPPSEAEEAPTSRNQGVVISGSIEAGIVR